MSNERTKTMFNKDFYPTPKWVIDTMLANTDVKDKVILEPSAGKGNIIDYLKQNGAKEVLCCENNEDLAKICSTKARLIEKDFLKLTSERISHIDMIVMNPPFSADEKHILHAWNIAPAGCEIISLCNYNTYDLAYSRERQILKNIINTDGYIENLGDVFSVAERKTDVNIGLVHLFKPKANDDEFEGYFDMGEEYERQENGIMPFNVIRDIVNRYVSAVKMFESVMETNDRMNDLIDPFMGGGKRIEFGVISDHYGMNRETFKKELQKLAWHSVFRKLKMEKYTTKSLMEQLNVFVEKQENVPFTMKNIYKMIEMIVGTHADRMNKVLIEVFDWLTDRHKGNRLGLEGWKTNSMYMVNEKFIMPYVGIERGWNGEPSIRWSSHSMVDDFIKALCFITGKNYDGCVSLYDFFRYQEVNGKRAYKEWGKWYNFNDLLEIKVFKKGTMHGRFLDKKLWEDFNKACAKAKGWRLPTNTGSDVRRKNNGVEIYKN